MNLQNTIDNLNVSGKGSFVDQIPSYEIFGGRIYYLLKFCAVVPSLFESAIKNLLCLQTLRHGTSMKNIICIKRNGGDPSISCQFEGKGWGVSPGLFYVMDDSPGLIIQIVKRLAPFEYKVAAERFELNNNQSVKGFILGLLDPTLKFYYQPHEVQRDFTEDPRLKNLGLITSKKVEVDRLGIQGALKFGLNKDWAARFKANPEQAIFGTIQIITCIALTFLTPLALMSIPILCIGQHYSIDRI